MKYKNRNESLENTSLEWSIRPDSEIDDVHVGLWLINIHKQHSNKKMLFLSEITIKTVKKRL